MLALPIARRELLVLSRASLTWRNRLGTSAAVFLFGILMAIMYHYAGQMALNQIMHFLGVGLSFVCLFTGVSLTADSIAEEKRGGTLGLLLLTNLSAFEILLGKLVAHGVHGLYTLLCAFPLLSVSMIFGGMRLSDVLIYLISALNILFFSAAAGLLASSICRDKRRSSSLGTLIILFFWGGLPVLTVLLSYAATPQWLIDLVSRLSVNFAKSLGIGLGSLMPSISPAWWNLLWPQILGWLLIGLAVPCLLRRWQDEPRRKRRFLRDVWKNISLGTPAARLKLRQRLIDRNPFMWLASRERLQAAVAWIISLSLMAVVGLLFFRGGLGPEVLMIMGVSISVLLQVSLSAAAGAQLFREYEQGTLELVLSTPFSADEVIRGQFAAALRQYRFLIALGFLLIWAGLMFLLWKAGPRQLTFVTAAAVCSGLFLLQFYAIGWVGMWSIAVAPDPRKATMNGFIIISILPGLLFGLIQASVQLFNWLVGTRFLAGPELWLPLFFILAFGNCIYWLRRAKRELPEKLRVFAFRRYMPEERPSLFGQIGRLVGRWVHRMRASRKTVVLNSP